MSVFGPHFEQVFNNHCPVNSTILDKITQHPVLPELDSPISFKEVDDAINKLKNGKALSINGIPPEVYKALHSQTRRKTHQYVAAFFKGHEDHDSWHKSQCEPVPKKGNLSNPNKRGGVMLMDVLSKMFLSVMNG
jgi:hypothetical protein